MSDDSFENNKLCLKTIYELLGEKFYIPAYQRGYRWSSIQVKELLDDIWEFSQDDSDKASFYCLQPVVVVQGNGHWEVVDGQQRLTSLSVLLQYLQKEHLRRDLQEAYKKSLFTLEYETRKGSEEFLQNINEEESGDNIDYHYIYKAYQTISAWFSDKDYNDNNAFLSTLLGKPGDTNSVQVIWYDLSDECKDSGYAIDVFSRINIGKIPLTNAELIKALFLQQGNFEEEKVNLKQIQIATEWDSIEARLQESSFWYFIYKPVLWQKYDSRIEYIFDLMKSKPPGAESFYTFHKFNEKFRQSRLENDGKPNIDLLWQQVKNYFLTFDEWYRDHELYHLIGFLVDCGRSVRKLKSVSETENMTKTSFKNYLREEIRKEISCDIDNLEYGDNKLNKILLFFNIQTLLSSRKEDTRFPFDRYKIEKWDIEHIRSQTEMEIAGKYRTEWLEDILEYFTDNRDPGAVDIKEAGGEYKDLVKESIRLLQEEKIDDELFDDLYSKVAKHFNELESVEWIDSLGNLALLDAATNRSYKNAMFPIKRKRIIENDKNGVFVPICTKNAFLKFYSTKMGDVMYWKESDAGNYVAAIKHILKDYLPETEISDV